MVQFWDPNGVVLGRVKIGFSKNITNNYLGIKNVKTIKKL
jgi:hypothetical protein